MRTTPKSKILAAITAAGLLFITACDSSSSSSTTEATTTTTLPLVAVPASGACSAESPCAVGDTGPGGGTIFYTSAKTFACGTDMTQGCNALEAAPSNWKGSITIPNGCANDRNNDLSCKLQSDSSDLGGKTFSDEIGGGRMNTENLKTVTSPSATAATSYKGGNFDDWYLPSYKEMLTLCAYSHGLDVTKVSELCSSSPKKAGMVAGSYWTSSRIDATKAWYVNVSAPFVASSSYTSRYSSSRQSDTTSAGSSARNNYSFVRPIRALAVTIKGASTATTTTTATATTVKETTTTVKTTTTVAKTCATGGTCAVGDTGPGGGKVYYVSTSGFPCGATLGDTCHYLEVSDISWRNSVTSPCTTPNTLSVFCAWGAASNTYVANDSHAGRGLKNSITIATTYNNTGGYAAIQAMAYRGGGKSDWYLPNNDELRMLCTWANGGVAVDNSGSCTAGTLKADFAGQEYWSSTDGGSGTVNTYNFTTGAHLNAAKDQLREVRPIRAG